MNSGFHLKSFVNEGFSLWKPVFGRFMPFSIQKFKKEEQQLYSEHMEVFNQNGKE